MRVSLVLKCPHCGKASSVKLGDLGAPSILDDPLPPTAKVRGEKAVCGCGHDRSHHMGEDGRGKCLYGEGTHFGACECTGFHSRRRTSKPKASDVPKSSSSDDIGVCASAILRVVAQRYPRSTPVPLALLMAGYVTSGNTSRALRALRDSGMVVDAEGGLEITSAGNERIGPKLLPAPTLAEIVAAWSEKFKDCASTLFAVIVRAHPKALTSEQLWRESGYSPSGNTSRALRSLRRANLVEEGAYRATDLLMRDTS